MDNSHHVAIVGNVVGWMLAYAAYLLGGVVDHLSQIAALASLALSLVLLYKELREHRIKD